MVAVVESRAMPCPLDWAKNSSSGSLVCASEAGGRGGSACRPSRFNAVGVQNFIGLFIIMILSLLLPVSPFPSFQIEVCSAPTFFRRLHSPFPICIITFLQ